MNLWNLLYLIFDDLLKYWIFVHLNLLVRGLNVILATRARLHRVLVHVLKVLSLYHRFLGLLLALVIYLPICWHAHLDLVPCNPPLNRNDLLVDSVVFGVEEARADRVRLNRLRLFI